MRKPSAKAHIAFGQACLLATLLCAAELLGLIPDRLEAERHGRAVLAEAVASNGSALVTRGDIERLEATLRLVVERNDEILSAAVRRESGRPVVTIGDHYRHWREVEGEYSTDTQLQVPLWSGGRKWGRAELRFEPLVAEGWLAFATDARTKLVAFLSIAGFIVFYFYLGRLLRYLDPSQAVPPHVRSALDTLAEGLMVIDRKHQIVLANRAFASIVGSTPDRLLGRKASELPWVTEEGAPYPPVEFPWARALETGVPQRNDMVSLKDGDSQQRTFIANCSPVLGSGGEYGGVLVSLDDVTELEAHKADLHAAKEEAEAANQAKGEFLANVSHEIRTPMNAILGFTEVLKRGYGKHEADRSKYLDTIHSSGRHLLLLINDLLDLSKIESGRLEVEQIRFAPHRLIQEAVTVLSVKAREKRIGLTFEVGGPIPETILSDPTRLRQIVTNLVSNAIKFTGEGSVAVVARLAAGGEKFCIEVSDSGIGVPEDKLEAIFDPFVQADTSVSRRFGGTGLGLPISRRFARLLGGDITARSDSGRGSTFTVTIAPGPPEGVRLLEPEEALAATQETTGDEAVRWEFPPASILVVDDGDENRELVQLVLEQVGLQVECAENGEVAVQKGLEGSFDAILMDVQMPVMDGFTATAMLRERGLRTPIYALTAHAMKGFDRECRLAGFSGTVTKPIDLDVLLRTLGECLGVEPRPGGAAEVPDAGAVADERPAAPQPNAGSPVVSRLASNPRLRPTIHKFAARLEEKLEAMETCWESGDLDELANLAHWLKGAGGTVGFDDFHAPAATLEELAKERKESEIEATLRELRGLADRIELPGDGG